MVREEDKEYFQKSKQPNLRPAPSTENTVTSSEGTEQPASKPENDVPTIVKKSMDAVEHLETAEGSDPK